MTILALVPARGGSKAIPRKNLAPLAGRPLIAWTLEAARKSPELDRVVVSTDDEEIAGEARRCGAEAPFRRPPELARDETPTLDVVFHALRWLEERQGYRPDHLLLLQPTSPFRTPEDIREAVGLARKTGADSVVGVCPVLHDHPHFLMRINDGGLVEPYDGTRAVPLRHQEIPPVYALNGAIYLARRETLLARRSWFGGQTRPYVMPVERSMDIDTPWEMYLADLIMRDRVRREAG